MLIIAQISEDINELIDLSDEYIEKAIETKELYPHLAEVYYSTYQELIESINNMHTQVVKFINQQDKSIFDESVWNVMMKVWTFKHKMLLEKMAELETKENIYQKL